MSIKSNFAAILVSFICAINISKSLAFEFKPYIGVDYQLNRMGFKNGYGNNLFPKHYKQINLYGGLKILDHLQIESGYVSTFSKTKYVTHYEGAVSLGAHIQSAISPVVAKSYIKVSGYHLSFVRNFTPFENENFRILGGIGLAFLKAEAYRHIISVGNPPIPGNIRKFNKHKAVLRFMLASEYKFKNNLGIRGSFFFLNTSRMIIKASPRINPNPSVNKEHTPLIKPKDSLVYSLGIFYDF